MCDRGQEDNVAYLWRRRGSHAETCLSISVAAWICALALREAACRVHLIELLPAVVCERYLGHLLGRCAGSDAPTVT